MMGRDRILTPFGVLVLGLATCLAPACSENTAPSDLAVDFTHLIIEPRTAELDPDQAQSFRARGVTASGDTLSMSVDWTANGGEISESGVYVAPDSSGLYTVVGADPVRGWLADTVQIDVRTTTVSQGPVASVSVSPAMVSIQPGQTAQITALTLNASGSSLNRPVTWSSSDPSVATVNGTGIVSAVTIGRTAITATSEGRSASASVTVTSGSTGPVASVTIAPQAAVITVGSTAQLSAEVRDASGNLLSGRVITWGTSGGSVASVDAGGTVTGVSAGTVTITAASEGQSGTATLTVTTVPVASVTVTPATASIVGGTSVQLSAAARDGAGNALNGRVITWSSSDPSVAIVDGSGLVAGISDGPVSITATSEGRSATAAITVTPAPVASVAVVPASAVLSVSATAQFAVRLRDVAGTPLSGRTVSWTTSNSGVATVSGSGIVSGVAPGTVTITGTSEGLSGNSSVTVTTVPVASVTVLPATASIQSGTTTQLAASVRDNAGSLLTGRVVTWSSSNSAAAAVDGSGLVTGVGAGTAIIAASSEGQSGTSTVTVTVAPVASVTVSPGSSALQVGQTMQLTAVPRDAAGNPLAGRTITWTSSNTGVALVNSSGLVTTTGLGSATITASSEGQNGSATVTVSSVAVANVAVSPATASVQAGQTTQLTATPEDASGNPLNGRSVTWSSSNTSVAAVDGSGLVTGLNSGTVTITATSEGQSGTSSVAVTGVPVASVSVTPGSTSVAEANTVQLTATPEDAAGNPLSGRAIGWGSSNTSLATVNGSGLVAGVGIGTVTITATSEGRSGSATVTVNPATVVTVDVSPNPANVAVGGLLQLTATPRAGSGNAILGRTSTWSSSNPSVASVDSQGRVSGVSQGTATVTATVDGVVGSTSVTVSVVTSNEPLGYTAFTDRSWSALATCGDSFSRIQSWDDLEGCGLSLVNDATAPKSPSSVLRTRYPAGFAGGTGSGVAQYFLSSHRVRNLYLSVWAKLSSNFQGHQSSTNKMFFLSIAGEPRFFVSAEGAGQGILRPALRLQGTLPDPRPRLMPNVVTNKNIDRGQWQHWELVLECSPGASNTRIRYWVDGVLVSDYPSIGLVGGSESCEWDEFVLRSVWGGIGDVVQQEQSIYWDHIYISGN